MADYFLGIDLGGTKILTAVADEEGNILAKIKLPTEAHKGKDKVIDNIIVSINKVLNKVNLNYEDIVRMGVGIPGPLNIEEGLVYQAPNLGWENVPISEILEEKTSIPVNLENDANAAALGEKWFGAGQGIDNLLYITISTGIGGGIIIDRKIYHGANDGAGEIGHMVIEPNGPLCGCGNYGCLEALASGTAISRMGKEAVEKHQNTIILELSNGNLDSIDGGIIAKAAKMGDEVAKEIWVKAGYYLGIGLANLLNIFNPEMIILGGGVMKAGDLIMEPMQKSLKKYSFENAFNSVQIRQAVLGDEVGVKGAIAVAIGRK